MLVALIGLTIATMIVVPLLTALGAVRSILLPIVIGFGLAYVVNPLVVWLHVKAKIPRGLTGALFGLGRGVAEP